MQKLEVEYGHGGERGSPQELEFVELVESREQDCARDDNVPRIIKENPEREAEVQSLKKKALSLPPGLGREEVG